MELQIALIVSALFQLVALIIIISLIPKTKFNIAWISISVGFLLMAIRRGIEVFYIFFEEKTDDISTISAWLAVIISLTMLIASVYINKIFEVISRINRLRKENEAKLLSSIMSTEEKERKSFSKELHDGLGPILSSIKMTLSAVDKKNMNSLNTELLDKIDNLIDSAIEGTKEISNNLTPHVLERYGLKKAVENFIRNISSKKNTDINIVTDIKTKRYEHKTEVILYRICCELINNTLKYADADKISVLITESNENLELKYDDDGTGFDIEKAENKGMGLSNIQSRVASLNGALEMKSSHNKGFYAHIKLPI